MAELFLLLLFAVLPLVLGYTSRSLAVLLVPVALALLAGLQYSPGYSAPPDEVDVIDDVFFYASLVGVFVCLVGVALGRRARSSPR